MSVAEVLGFEPSQFLDEVSSETEKKLDIGINKLKQDLIALASSRSSSSSAKSVSVSDIEKACKKLHKLMKEHFDRNMDKFEVYCMRNIFVPPTAESSSSKSSASSGKDDLESVTKQVEELRSKYEDAVKRHSQMTMELKMGEALLKEMKNAHFKLMVATQVLDEYNVNPLEDSMATLNENKQSLQELCGKAYTLTKQMESYLKDVGHEQGEEETEWGGVGQQPITDDSSGGAPIAGGGVQIAGTSDIQNVTRSIMGMR